MPPYKTSSRVVFSRLPRGGKRMTRRRSIIFAFKHDIFVIAAWPRLASALQPKRGQNRLENGAGRHNLKAFPHTAPLPMISVAFRSASLPRTLQRATLLIAISVSTSVMAAALQLQTQDAAGKPLPDAIVFLESPQARTAVKPLQGVEIAQVARQFTPQVTVVPVGSSLQFPNRDTVRHHVYSFSPVKFELKLYIGSPANLVVFDKPGIAVLGCNIHDNMTAWVVIVETPYYGRSGADGKLALDNVPAGNYRLRVWHQNLPVGAPAIDQPLTVTAAGAAVTVKVAGLAP